MYEEHLQFIHFPFNSLIFSVILCPSIGILFKFILGFMVELQAPYIFPIYHLVKVHPGLYILKQLCILLEADFLTIMGNLNLGCHFREHLVEVIQSEGNVTFSPILHQIQLAEVKRVSYIQIAFVDVRAIVSGFSFSSFNVVIEGEVVSLAEVSLVVPMIFHLKGIELIMTAMEADQWFSFLVDHLG